MIVDFLDVYFHYLGVCDPENMHLHHRTYHVQKNRQFQ